MEKRVKQSSKDTYARITREHFELEQKEKQKHLLEQLRRLLWFFEETFVKEPSEREPNHRDWPFIWPNAEDFTKLDELIFGLAYSLRKKKRLSHPEAYGLVGDHWTSLKLGKFLRRFAKRIAALRLDPPPPNPARKHFEWIIKLADGKSSNSACAKKFLSTHRKLRHGTATLSQIKWDQYRDVLNTQGSQSIRLDNHLIPFPPNSAIECYAKYLELDRGLLLWEAAYRVWEEETKPRQALYDWDERNDLRDDALLTQSEEKRKADWRKRKKQQRFREKVARIRVTGGPTGSLADLTL